MRPGAVALIVFLAGETSAFASQNPDQPTTRQYIKRSLSPLAVVRAGVGAAVTQATDTPHEWGQGAAGFGKRLGSAFAKHLVKKAIQLPVARLLHEEIGYRRSDQQGFRPRLQHALLATVITYKTTNGKKTIAVDEIAGAFGSGLISRLWQPASVRALSYGFLSGGITLGVDAGTNVLREFWPEIRHPHGHHQQGYLPEPSVQPSPKP
ncbi:MAG: hypothetical protein WBE37_25510 [Bryobacteraceae bacterium]